jgi:hypothetical protein
MKKNAFRAKESMNLNDVLLKIYQHFFPASHKTGDLY